MLNSLNVTKVLSIFGANGDRASWQIGLEKGVGGIVHDRVVVIS